MRRPNLNRLSTFDAAARHLNFGLAARELNVTQGAVAQQVRALEADLQRRLFERLPRGLELTQIGRGYHARIHRALVLIDEATHDISPATDKITLSVPPSLASKWLVSRLADFQNAYPDIELVINASEQLANFRSDGVDIAVRLGEPKFSAGLEFQHLADINLCAVCTPAFAEKVGTIDAPAELASFRLIEDGHNSWASLIETQEGRVRPNTIKFNHSALAIDAALAGQGIALVPRILLKNELTEGLLISVWSDTKPNQSGYFVLYPRKPKGRQKARDTVVRWLIQQGS